jgi:hypothetical protein
MLIQTIYRANQFVEEVPYIDQQSYQWMSMKLIRHIEGVQLVVDIEWVAADIEQVVHIELVVHIVVDIVVDIVAVVVDIGQVEAMMDYHNMVDFPFLIIFILCVCVYKQK